MNYCNLYGYNLQYYREIIPENIKFDIELLCKISFTVASITIGYAKEKQVYKKEVVLMHKGFNGVYYKKIYVIDKQIANNFIKHFGLFQENAENR